jgi:hypothetical protein
MSESQKEMEFSTLQSIVDHRELPRASVSAARRTRARSLPRHRAPSDFR